MAKYKTSSIATEKLRIAEYRVGLRDAWEQMVDSSDDIDQARALAFNLFLELLDLVNSLEKELVETRNG